MKLSSVLSQEMIDVKFKARNKEEAIKKLVNIAAKHSKHVSEEALLNDVMEREEQTSTGVGNGIAFPHARIKGLDDFIVVIGLADESIDFNAPDKKPVNMFILIFTSHLNNTLMLQSLAAFSRLLSNENTRRDMLNAKTSNDVIKIVDKTNIEIKKAVTAKDIMHSHIVTLRADMNLHDVIKLFVHHSIAGAPVVNSKNEVIGELTEKHLIQVGLPEYMNMLDNLSFLRNFEPFVEFFKKEDVLTVRDTFSKEFPSVTEDTSIVEVAFLMVNKSCRRVYVLCGKELIGMISRHDLINKVLYL